MQVPSNPSSGELSAYSLAQMEHFYQAFAAGNIKPTSVMNYLQHLVIAEQCHPGDWVLDVCCGRALQIPILKHLVPALGGYVGMDIAQEHLDEATDLLLAGDNHLPAFPCSLLQGDVTTDLIAGAADGTGPGDLCGWGALSPATAAHVFNRGRFYGGPGTN